MYNATMKTGASVVGTSGNDTVSPMSNPLQRNRFVPPPLNGALASKEYSDAMKARVFAQLNVPKFYCGCPQYNNY